MLCLKSIVECSAACPLLHCVHFWPPKLFDVLNAVYAPMYPKWLKLSTKMFNSMC